MSKTFARAAFALAAVLAVAGLAWIQPRLAAAAPTLTLGEPAPELAGIEAWIGSEPLALGSLRGKVVAIEFWTYACGNCVRTLPKLAEWHERHAADGLVIVGVHTPEFGFERDVENVRAAVRRYAIPYPVAIDNGFRTWSAYRNRYWPALYVVDRSGRLVLAHAGEDGYDAIETVIRRELARSPNAPD